MKNLALICLTLLLAACAQTQPQPAVPLTGAASSNGLYATGTLARTGTCEMDVASDWTALAAFAHRADRMLRNGPDHRRAGDLREFAGALLPETI